MIDLHRLTALLLPPTAKQVTPRSPRRRYALQTRIGFSQLKFLPELEAEYSEALSDFVIWRLHVLAITFAYAALIGILVGSWPASLAPVTPLLNAILGLILFCAATPALLVQFAGPRTHAYALLLGSVSLIAVGSVLAIAVAQRVDPQISAAGLLMVSVFVFGISLRTRHAAIVCVLAALLYVIASLAMSGAMVLGKFELLTLLVTNLICLAARYQAEFHSREGFLAMQTLAFDAFHDPLTGLLNRRAFKVQSQELWKQAARDGRKLGVAAIDLDHFKEVNDRYGHLVGDRVLRAAASALKARQRRPLDRVGRFGGDELIAIWYDVSRDWLEDTLREMHAAMNATLIDAGGEAVPVRTSIGAVVLQPSASNDLTAALRQADSCLYEVKRTGRGRVRVLTMLLPQTRLRGGVSRMLMR